MRNIQAKLVKAFGRNRHRRNSKTETSPRSVTSSSDNKRMFDVVSQRMEFKFITLC